MLSRILAQLHQVALHCGPRATWTWWIIKKPCSHLLMACCLLVSAVSSTLARPCPPGPAALRSSSRANQGAPPRRPRFVRRAGAPSWPAATVRARVEKQGSLAVPRRSRPLDATQLRLRSALSTWYGEAGLVSVAWYASLRSRLPQDDD
jgi:hypothetical protein